MQEYNLEIYPRTLWIELVSKESVKSLSEVFYNSDETPLETEIILTSKGSTHRVTRKRDQMYGYLVTFNPDCLLNDTIAHEMYHVADGIGDELGLMYNKDSGNEHYAYLLGYLVRKCDDFIKTLEKDFVFQTEDVILVTNDKHKWYNLECTIHNVITHGDTSFYTLFKDGELDYYNKEEDLKLITPYTT